MLKVEHLTKKYSGNTALSDISFSVEKGKIYGFLGPNGAGKSTAMNIITGYICATQGSVQVDGIDIFKYPQKAKAKIGYLPETPPLYADMTAKEYLMFVAELKGIKPRNNRQAEAERLIKEVGITGMENRLIKFLSKGYKQRVGLAAALVANPELLILDEPTVGLDPKQIKEIRQLIVNLKKNHTILISSHILSEISAICDHVLILSQGKLVASKPTDKLAELAGKATSYYCEIQGAKKDLQAVLTKLNSINNVKIKTVRHGITSAEFTSALNVDPRTQVVAAITAAGLQLLEIKQCEQSLEQTFLQLTETENKEVQE